MLTITSAWTVPVQLLFMKQAWIMHKSDELLIISRPFNNNASECQCYYTMKRSIKIYMLEIWNTISIRHRLSCH